MPPDLDRNGHYERMGTVDEYLAGLDQADVQIIGRIYDIARGVVPDATQGTSYGMPALLHAGKPLISVKRTRKHIGIYPFSADAVAAAVAAQPDPDALDFDKGTIRLPLNSPVPEDLIRTLVETRRDQIDG